MPHNSIHIPHDNALMSIPLIEGLQEAPGTHALVSLRAIANAGWQASYMSPSLCGIASAFALEALVRFERHSHLPPVVGSRWVARALSACAPPPRARLGARICDPHRLLNSKWWPLGFVDLCERTRWSCKDRVVGENGRFYSQPLGSSVKTAVFTINNGENGRFHRQPLGSSVKTAAFTIKAGVAGTIGEHGCFHRQPLGSSVKADVFTVKFRGRNR